MSPAGDGPSRRVALGPGGEFDLIRRLLGPDGAVPPEVEIGPGDDAVVLEGGWVLSSDLTVEGVHFRRDWLADREVGHRAAAAALSDLAAMAARPVGALLSLAVPTHGVDVEELQEGACEALGSSDAVVLGGDLSRSPGPLVVDVIVVGKAARPVPRVGARPGDELWVTGSLGAAAAAVALWEGGREPGPELREAFARPRPRIREARFLVDEGGIHALVDLSDGLAGDAGHLAAAGGVRIVLEPGTVPVAETAIAALGAEQARSLAMHGGEDYELLFAATAGSVDRQGFLSRFDVALTRVGRVEEGEGVWVADEGGLRRIERGGYSHALGEGV